MPVKPIRYQIFGVKLVEDPVCIVLHRSREDDKLVDFTHLLKELVGTWPDQEMSAYLGLVLRVAILVEAASALLHFYIMNQCLVKVENQGEF